MEGAHLLYIASGDGALPIVPEGTNGLLIARLIDSRGRACHTCEHSQGDRESHPACLTHSAPPRQGCRSELRQKLDRTSSGSKVAALPASRIEGCPDSAD